MTPEAPAHDGKPPSRIRQKNEEAILKAAENEFARHGFRGTSMNAIALSVGLPKANLHYYFTNKLTLYITVLGNIIELWGNTQHYADFSTRIYRVTGRKLLSKQDMQVACDNLIRIILKGCGLTPTV